MPNEIIVTGCGDCPMRSWATDILVYCLHPEHQSPTKYNYSDLHEQCPLKQNSILIQLKQNEKETIEEAANKWIDSFYQKEKEYHKVGRNKCSPQLGFIAGAEWQKEQSISVDKALDSVEKAINLSHDKWKKQQFITPTDEEIEEKGKKYSKEKSYFPNSSDEIAIAYQAGYKQALIDLQNQTK